MFFKIRINEKCSVEFKKSAYGIEWTGKSWFCGNNINGLREKRLGINQNDNKGRLWVVGLKVIFAFLSTYIYIFHFLKQRTCFVFIIRKKTMNVTVFKYNDTAEGASCLKLKNRGGSCLFPPGRGSAGRRISECPQSPPLASRFSKANLCVPEGTCPSKDRRQDILPEVRWAQRTNGKRRHAHLCSSFLIKAQGEIPGH